MRRHRAVRSRRHDLPQRLFTTIARSKHTRNVRLRALARHKIPVFVKVKNIAYKVRRRHIAHRHKHTVHLNLAHLVRLYIAQTQPADFSVFFEDLIRHRIENDLDIWLIELLLIAL